MVVNRVIRQNKTISLASEFCRNMCYTLLQDTGGGGLLRQYNGNGGGVKEVSLPDPLKRPNLRHIAHAYLGDLEYSNNNKFRASFSPFSAFILYTLRFQINGG